MIGNKNLELNQTGGQGGNTKAVSMFRLVELCIVQLCLNSILFIVFSQLLDISVQQLCDGRGEELGGEEAQPAHHQDSGRHHGAEAGEVQ